MNKKLTVEQAARYLGVSTKTLRRWEADGYLMPSRTSGHHRRYAEKQLLTFKDKKYSRTKTKVDVKKNVNHALNSYNFKAPVATESARGTWDSLQEFDFVNIFKKHTQVILMHFSSFKWHKKVFLAGLLSVLVLSLFAVAGKSIVSRNQVLAGQDGLVYNQQSSQAVLGESIDPNFTFKVNVPSEFGKTATFTDGLTVQGKLVLGGKEETEGETVIITNNGDMDLGTGLITASNIVYSIKAGTGITVTGGQTPTITNSGVTTFGDATGDIDLGTGLSIASNTLSNSDKGSSQNIFKSIKIGGSTIVAGSNTDTVEFTAGTGITLAANTTDKKITITAESSGWAAGTGYTSLNTITDSVGIGTTVPTSKLHVVGSTNLAGGVILGSSTSDTISYIGRVSSDIIPSATGTYSLGSDSNRWSQLYLTGVVAVGGQATFTSQPTGTGVGQGAIYINPPSVADNNYTLFGIAVGGIEKLRMDATGNIAVQGNFLGPTTGSVGYWTRSDSAILSPYSAGDGIFTTGSIGAGALTSDYKLSAIGIEGMSPFNIASSSGTSLLNVAADGSVGIGTTSPTTGAKLTISGGDINIVDTETYKLYFDKNYTLDRNRSYISTGVTDGTGLIIHSGVSGGNTQLLRFQVGNDTTGKMVINDSGNVGIGNTSPLVGLHVGSAGTRTYAAGVDDLFVSGDIENDGLIFTPDMRASAYRLNGATLISGVGLNPVSFGDQVTAIKFRTSATDNIMYMSSAGDVGIGTTSPVSKLTVNGNITTLGYNSFQGASGIPAYIAGNVSGSIQSAMSSIVAPYNQWFINTSGRSIALQSLPRFGGNGTYANQDGTYVALALEPLYNQLSGTGSNTDLLINRTETLLTSGAQYLIDAQVYNTTKFNVTNTGQGYFAGSVGVGITSPGIYKLNVVGLDAGTSNYVFNFQNSTGTRYINMRNDGTFLSNQILSFSGGFGIDSFSSGAKIIFETGGEASGNIIINGSTSNGATGSIELKAKATVGSVYVSQGNFGIGTTTPAFKLDVADTQAATGTAMIKNLSTDADADVLALKIAGATAETGNNFLTFLNGNGEIIGKVNGNGSGGVSYGTTGIDFAEYFVKTNRDEDLSVGALVCNKDGGATACNSSSNAILGVISDRAGFIGGTQHQDNPAYVAVGLVGQLRVKISNSNGEIKAGDPLTTSDSSGIAVKATSKGYILGRALENSIDSSGNTREMIMVNINPSFYDPSTEIADANLATDLVQDLASRISFLENLISIRASASSGLIDLISAKTYGQASSAAELFENIEAENLTLNNNATILGNLIVGGRTVVNDIGVTGNLTLGLLSIRPEGEINVLGQDLKLQPEQTGGVNILAGKITIQKDGTANFTENATFEKDIIIKGVLSAESIEITGKESVGSAKILAGETSIEIKSTEMKSKSRVLVTPNTVIDIPLIVTDKINGSFTVKIKDPQSESVNFDWLIVR